jgi:hypothetical protein
MTFRPGPPDVEEQWGVVFGRTTWSRIQDAVPNTAFIKQQTHREMGPINLGYWLNSYIMTTAGFSEYMDFAFESIARFEALLPEPAGSRLFGHVAERLFSITARGSRIPCCGFLSCRWFS